MDATGTLAPRTDFPVLDRTIDGRAVDYLDSAATSLKPTPVIEAVTRFYAEVGANIHRGKHRLSDEASTEYERVRYRVSDFIGCRSSEVVFTWNTTAGLNAVADGLDLGPDDHVVAFADAHHSNLLPWRRHGPTHLVRIDDCGRPDLDHYAELLNTLRPRLVALNHVSNVTGLVAPVASMTAMAKAVGAVVVLDAAQSAPHQRLAVGQLGVDFMAFSGHKMLGPTGIGILVVRAEMADTLRPAVVGGGVVDWVELTSHTLRRAPHRYEAGTPNISGVYGLGAALDYLDGLGMERVAQHDDRMAACLLREAAARPHLTVAGGGEPGDRAGIVSFLVAGVPDLGDLARILSDSYGVMARSGHLCAQPLVDRLGGPQVLRFSAYVYNSEADVRYAFERLDEVYELIGADVTATASVDR